MNKQVALCTGYQQKLGTINHCKGDEGKVTEIILLQAAIFCLYEKFVQKYAQDNSKC